MMRSANHTRKLTAIALAATLGFAATGTTALAAQSNSSESDHSSSVSASVSDTWITTKVKTELATTKDLDSTDVSVDTKDGVVTLTGVLPTDTMVKKAVAVAKSIKGVKDVDHSGLKSK